MKRLLWAVALCAVAGSATAQPTTGERDDVVAVVQRFFDSMATRDIALATSVLVSDGHFFAVRQEKGETIVRSTSVKDYLARPAGKERLLERMWNPEVKVHGAIATLWAPYDFYRDGAFSHCGIDAFDLIKTKAGWQIASIVYTVERENCPKSPLGPPK